MLRSGPGQWKTNRVFYEKQPLKKNMTDPCMYGKKKHAIIKLGLFLDGGHVIIHFCTIHDIHTDPSWETVIHKSLIPRSASFTRWTIFYRPRSWCPKTWGLPLDLIHFNRSFHSKQGLVNVPMFHITQILGIQSPTDTWKWCSKSPKWDICQPLLNHPAIGV